MAKVTVVSDKSGSIIATLQNIKGSANAPSLAPLRLADGQQSHEVDVPDQLAALDVVAKLHSTHLIQVKGGAATLVQRGKS